jgi:hypothetical protein
MTTERYQKPKIGDSLILRQLFWSANLPTDVYSIPKVEIYQNDSSNPNDFSNLRLIETVLEEDIIKDDVGAYHINLILDDDKYTVGKYLDVWNTLFEASENESDIIKINNYFEIFRNVWFSSPVPLIYDFSFSFRPNQLAQGSKQYIIVQINPNVPTVSELQQYYCNIATVSPIYISIAQRCGDCVPEEEDLRLIIDRELVQVREHLYGYYKLDTTDIPCGIYDVWFELETGDNLYISPKNQIQIFK